MALYLVNPTAVVSSADLNQIVNVLNGTTSGVQITNSSRIRAQLTGATSGAGGYTGQVTSGAPVAGTFSSGDFVSDGGFGNMWVCTTGGTPGTWTTGPTRIATTVLGGATSSVTFSSVPAFNHLRLLWHSRTTSGNVTDNVWVRFNGDTGANYNWELTSGLNTTVTAAPGIGDSKVIVGGTVGGTGSANFFGNGAIDILGWSQATSSHILTVTGHWYACWSNTAATSQVGVTGGFYDAVASSVTSVTILPAAGQWATGSVFSLYGLM